MQEPPGGPPDLTPPVLLSVSPDSGATVPGLKDAAVFQFNEVVAERPGAQLEQMVLVSPRPRLLEVSWRRSAIAVKPREGWQPGVVYRLTLLPGVTDLRANRLPTGKTVVFSTGGAIPSTAMTGQVIDWEAGNAAALALVEAIRMPDSVVYWDVADSAGRFSMVAVPPGQYVLSASIDKNSNRRRDYREPFDSTVVTLDSSVASTFWAFTHDSVGPRIRALSRTDSVTIRVEFNQPLSPRASDSSSISVAQLPDSVPVPVTALLKQSAYDSLQAAGRVRPTDSAGANRPVAPGGVGPPPAAQPAPQPVSPSPGQVVGQPGRGIGAGAPPPPDSALTRLLKERERLGSSLIVRVGEPLKSGGRYLVRAKATNAAGAVGESSSVLVLPAPADTTKKVR